MMSENEVRPASAVSMAIASGRRGAVFSAIICLAASMPNTAKATIFHIQKEFATITGHRIKVFSGVELRLDCSIIATPTVRIISQPTHGQASQSREQLSPLFPLSDARSKCNDRTFWGPAIYYVPGTDFVGRDSFVAQIGLSKGKVDLTFNVDIQ